MNKEIQSFPDNTTHTEKRKAAVGLIAVFVTQFVSFLFINARNIAQPSMVNELNGWELFSWLLALPALAGSVTTLLFGKLSDMFGRKLILLGSLILFLSGMFLVPLSKTMLWAVLARTFMSLGHWPIVPLCFSAIGDLFPPRQRARWTGMLNISSWAAAMVGPVLGGFLAESLWGWRGLYYGMIPLIMIAGALVALGVPGKKDNTRFKFDYWGTFVMVIATATLIFGFSRLSSPETRVTGLILLLISIITWVVFITIENKSGVPILDPHLMSNHVFLRVASNGLLIFFGSLGITAYATIFAQDVMQISPMVSGSILTPYTILTAFMGIPTGFLLAKTKKFKWMYNISAAMLTLAFFIMCGFTAETPIWVYILVTSIAGFGLGVIPTLNTLVVQFAVPKRLLGMSVGALFFFQMIGIAVAPSILGLFQTRALDLASGLKSIFLVCAIATALAFVIILTIPAISMDEEVPDTR